MLLKRLDELVSDRKTMKNDKFFNFRAGSLASTATALLALDPGATDAANALLALLKHPCASNRDTALMGVAEVAESEPKTEAAGLLHAEVAARFEKAEQGEFRILAKSLARVMPDRVLARCRELLASKDASLRDEIVSTLAEIRSPKAIALALQWLPRIASLHSAITVATILAPLVPEPTLQKIARRALSDDSPFCRWSAVSYLLPALPRKIAKQLSAAAMRDEPDPALRRLLQK
jgi:hypothetical protein